MVGACCLLILGGFLRQQVERWRRLSGPPLPVLGVLRDFQLTNQVSQTITLESLRGQVCLFDIIFSRCPGPCTVITRHLVALQKSIPENFPVKFVALTTDPQHDTPAELARYGKVFGADPARFYFLTGPAKELYRLATSPQGGLMLAVVETKPEERERPADLFVHSTRFVLVDKRGQIRAFFDGERPEIQNDIEAAVERLARETYP